MKRVLISVSDKKGIEGLAGNLQSSGYRILASGGTAAHLMQCGIEVERVEDYTHSPELLQGRVKTLHPFIHAGLLARESEEDASDLKRLGIDKIDMLICNLYPFEKTIRKAGALEEEIIENIDIGGVSLLRAAAKNYLRVLTVSSPDDYDEVIAKLGSGFSLKFKERMAVKAFSICAHYDVAITEWLQHHYEQKEAEELHFQKMLLLQDGTSLRYGENPHQMAMSYKNASEQADGILSAKVLQGKELSYNNILDLDVAFRVATSFSHISAVLVKHQCPTGIAEVKDEKDKAYAIRYAIKSDPVSAYGGILALKSEFDAECCKEIEGLFLECIVAPSFSNEALGLLAKRKNCRLLCLSFAQITKQFEIKSIIGGYLLQDMDIVRDEEVRSACYVTNTKLEEESLEESFKFAWKALQMIKSNAIVLIQRIGECEGYYTCGIGGGQPNRVDATRDALRRAKEEAKGAILASDAFIPFVDTIKEAYKHGIKAVLQPGGSIRDDECIQFCNEHGIAMLFVGMRHFKH